MSDPTLWIDRALDIASETVADGGPIGAMVVSRALLKLNGLVETLYGEIVHGDEAHRAWLLAKMEEHFGMKGHLT